VCLAALRGQIGLISSSTHASQSACSHDKRGDRSYGERRVRIGDEQQHEQRWCRDSARVQAIA
jgi:hypothetical protein